MPAITFSGLASGIDADAIIKALTDAKRVSTMPLQNQIDQKTEQNAALEKFNTKMLAFRSALDDFLTLSGGGIAKTATSSNSDAITATASSGALNNTTTISSVAQLAKSATFSFNDRFTALDEPIAAGLSAPAEIQFVVGTGESAETINVEVTNETTLADLADAINAAAPGKLNASILNTGTESAPSYALIVNTQQTGLDKGALNVNVAGELTGLGLFSSSTVDPAQDAVFTVAGLGEITRSTNQINDLFPGLSFTLKQVTAQPVTISVTNDAAATSSKVQAVVEAFNDLIAFSAANSRIERVEGSEEGNATNVFGSLARTRVDEQAVQTLKGVFASTNSGVAGSSIQIFADLGIKIDALGKSNEGEGEEAETITGIFEFDAAEFEEALTKDPTAVQNLFSTFADAVAKTDGIISNYTQLNGQIDTAINAGETQIESLNDRIERIERNIAAQEEMLRKVFTNLETKVSRLNSGSAAIASILALPAPK